MNEQVYAKLTVNITKGIKQSNGDECWRLKFTFQTIRIEFSCLCCTKWPLALHHWTTMLRYRHAEIAPLPLVPSLLGRWRWPSRGWKLEAQPLSRCIRPANGNKIENTVVNLMGSCAAAPPITADLSFRFENSCISEMISGDQKRKLASAQRARSLHLWTASRNSMDHSFLFGSSIDSIKAKQTERKMRTLLIGFPFVPISLRLFMASLLYAPTNKNKVFASILLSPFSCAIRFLPPLAFQFLYLILCFTTFHTN